jgi:hypothetical protein
MTTAVTLMATSDRTACKELTVARVKLLPLLIGPCPYLHCGEIGKNELFDFPLRYVCPKFRGRQMQGIKKF